MYSIRTSHPGDYERLAPIMSILNGSPLTAQLLRERDEKNEKATQICYVAESGGELLGFGRAFRGATDTSGAMWIAVTVIPEHRRHGIGGALFEKAAQFAEPHDLVRLESKIRDSDPESLKFVEQRGFTVHIHQFESVLDAARFDPSTGSELLQSLGRQGIRFASYAEASDKEAFFRQIHGVNVETGRDTPGTEPGWDWPYEEFRDDILKAHWLRPEGQILAFDGDEPIGLAAIGEFAPGDFQNTMTGVRRPYRGRGIALALKVVATRAAIRLGAKTITTQNDSTNAAMIAINRKLGYVQQPGWLWIRKPLRPERETA